ncbi:MAG: hypothetical protein O7E57_01490 [Gammaproteobacteria bacterium]|nr:hypothetical protein [Gammaproteobacteria bacterium]
MDNRFDRVFPSRDIKTEGSRPALIDNGSFAVDDIKPLGMRGVRPIGGVIHIIEQSWHGKFQAQYAGFSHPCSLPHGFGLVENHIVIQVMGQLPAIFRMRLGDVNAEEVGPIDKPLKNPIEAPGLVTERRSGVTAEQ